MIDLCSLTPEEAALCRLIVAAHRSSRRPGINVRLDYQHHRHVGALIYTRIDRSDLRGPGITLNPARHGTDAMNTRADAIDNANL